MLENDDLLAAVIEIFEASLDKRLEVWYTDRKRARRKVKSLTKSTPSEQSAMEL